MKSLLNFLKNRSLKNFLKTNKIDWLRFIDKSRDATFRVVNQGFSKV